MKDIDPKTDSPVVTTLCAYALGFPSTLLLAFFSTWTAGRLALGYWPRPSLDDPKSIGPWVDGWYAITYLLLTVGLWLLVFAELAIIWRAGTVKAERKNSLLIFTLSTMSLVAACYFLRSDSFALGDWFMD